MGNDCKRQRHSIKGLVPEKNLQVKKNCDRSDFRRFFRHLRSSHITLHLYFHKIKKLMDKDEALARSPGVTYYFIMGFVPFLIFMVNVLLFTTAADIDFVLDMVRTYFPERMAETLTAEIRRIVSQRSNLWMWASLFFSCFSFERGLSILVRSTDPKAYSASVDKSQFMIARSNVLVHLKSILYAVGLVVSIILSLGLTVFGNILMGWIVYNFDLPLIVEESWHTVTYTIPFLVLIMYLSIFYLTAPRSYTPSLASGIFTALLVTLLWLLATMLYRCMLELIPGIGESYGPLFGLFTMFIWFSYIATIIILGIYLVRFSADKRRMLDRTRHAM